MTKPLPDQPARDRIHDDLDATIFVEAGAGTGKTSVLKVFLQELARAEGHHPTLLLAPTGKARVRLSTKTERNAMTIPSFC